MREKNRPIESGNPAFWNVASVPEAAPRWRAGTLFITLAMFGEANMPKAMPFTSSMAANTG